MLSKHVNEIGKKIQPLIIKFFTIHKMDKNKRKKFKLLIKFFFFKYNKQNNGTIKENIYVILFKNKKIENIIINLKYLS